MASVINNPIQSVVALKDKHKRLIKFANKIMLLSLSFFLASVWVSYGIELSLALPAEIVAHLLTIVSAAIFKLGYAVRCVGAFNLGHKAF